MEERERQLSEQHGGSPGCTEETSVNEWGRFRIEQCSFIHTRTSTHTNTHICSMCRYICVYVHTYEYTSYTSSS